MRFIDPKKIIINRFKNDIIPTFDIAILLFRDKIASNIIKDVLKCKPVDRKIFWGISSENTSICNIGKLNCIIIEQLIWGGPQAAIISEELAIFGIKEAIGIGACGSINEKFKKNDLVIDTKAFCTDGTSSYYTKAKYIKPSIKLINEFKKNDLKEATSSTIDAIYQETDKIITKLKKNGSNIVNMESAAFYAATNCCNIDSIWIGCVSDTLFKNDWDDWFDSKEATVKTAVIIKKYLEENVLTRT